MRKKDCLKWAEALINGKYKKHKNEMSNAKSAEDEPTACCCLGVLNETFRPTGYKYDRTDQVPYIATRIGIIGDASPRVYGFRLSDLNDGCGDCENLEMTHEEIGTLLLFAIESGEYKNI